MRDFKNMKRQRGRNRSGGAGGGGGGGRPQQNANRAFESNGPDNVKIRGHAQHVFEKYQQLARDAFSSGDRVLAENYLQHADHYFRLLRTIQPNRPPSEILGRDTVASGLDIDFEEEIEAQSEDAGATEPFEGGGGQQSFEPRQDGGRYERDTRQDRYDGGRNDNSRNDNAWRDRSDNRPERDRQDNRQDRDRQDNRPDNRQDNRVGFDRSDRGYGERQDRNRNSYGDRPQEGERTDRFEGRRDNRRFDTGRSDAGRNDANRNDTGRNDSRNVSRDGREPRFEARSDGFAEGPQPPTPEALEPSTVPVATASAVSVERAEASQVLRSEDGGVSEAPAFLQPAPGDSEEARPRARRRRAPRTFQPGDDGAEAIAPPPTGDEG